MFVSFGVASPVFRARFRMGLGCDFLRFFLSNNMVKILLNGKIKKNYQTCGA